MNKLDILDKIEREHYRIDYVTATLELLAEVFENEIPSEDNQTEISIFLSRLGMFRKVFDLAQSSLYDISEKIYEAIEEIYHEQKTGT